jgi:3-phosphoshikimate 1-carboxyvinyltransferase
MHQRPQAALFGALRELGYRVDASSDHLPAVIHGGGPKPGATCTISIADSSQFASALMLCAGVGEWKIAVDGENAEESPYIVMTHRLIEAFPTNGGRFQVEPDASSGSYFWAAGWLVHLLKPKAGVERRGDWQGSPVAVRNWPATGWQIDAEFPEFLPLPPRISREDQLGDSIMTAIVVSADHEAVQGRQLTGSSPDTRFTDLARLRVQECERVLALRTELTKCGASVVEQGDTLTVIPTTLHGADIETYNDHRIAMCFAILGLKVPGIRLHHPACVKKTFPNFFQKLAAPPPQGLGVTILDAGTGRKLAGEELFAE